MVGTYRCKPRFENPETFLEIKSKEDKFSITHYFKSGITKKEVWSKEDLKDMKDQLTKVKEIKWKKKQEGDEKCQTKKKLAPKKKATKK